LSDALGSVAAILGGILVLGFDLYRADPALSIGISLLVAYSGWRILRQTAQVLMESTPPHVTISEVEHAILDCPGVAGLHDLHVWRISDGFDVLTVHVTLQPGAHGVEVSEWVRHRVRRDFAIEHVTVQPEAGAANVIVPLRQSRDGAVLSGPDVHRDTPQKETNEG
jgi:cobalt-zinc-cadmium efflux system protein